MGQMGCFGDLVITVWLQCGFFFMMYPLDC